jgi:deazaflavin-dependent oxidoreductase (nitroreductase family)
MRYTPSSYLIRPYLRLHGVVYRLTDGAVGRHVGGRPALLLHTVGRRTGEPRTTALIYARHDEHYLVVASNGGASRHPAWLLNVEAEPDVELQVGRSRQPARARVASGDERSELWQVVNRGNRGLARLLHRGATGRYDVYQRHTDREIPVVVIDPVSRPTP